MRFSYGLAQTLVLTQWSGGGTEAMPTSKKKNASPYGVAQAQVLFEGEAMVPSIIPLNLCGV